VVGAPAVGILAATSRVPGYSEKPVTQKDQVMHV
jgi:hypothetical protein